MISINGRKTFSPELLESVKSLLSLYGLDHNEVTTFELSAGQPLVAETVVHEDGKRTEEVTTSEYYLVEAGHLR